MTPAKVIHVVLILVSWTTMDSHVAGIASSTMGDHFIVQLTSVEGDDVVTRARAFTMSLTGVAVTMATKTSNGTSVKSATARQYEPASFLISSTLKCLSVGICQAIVFNGTGMFALDILTLLNPKNGDAMQLIPVNGFGTKYFVMSVGRSSFLILLSPWNDTKITFHLKTSGNSINVTMKLYKNGEPFSIVLGRDQCFNLLQCSNTDDLSGTILHGNKTFGVISGACDGVIGSNKKCKGGLNGNYLSDMALPLETYGKHFAVFERGIRTPNNRFAVVVTSEKNTTVMIKDEDDYKMFIAEAGTKQELRLFPNDHYFIVTDYPCACYLLLPSSCGESDFGDASITVVPPVELFFNVYMWSFQTDEYTSEMQTYILLIVHIWYLNKTLLNETHIYNKYSVNWESMIGTSKWMVGALHMQGGSHMFTLTSSLHKFGCHVLVASEGFGFVATPGFILANLNYNYQRCVYSLKRDYHDYIDNDCDGKIDEELLNELDDDGDTKVDEDVGMPDFVRGTWTHWDQWTCKGQCGESTYIKYRHCRSPSGAEVDIQCPGIGEKTKPGVCRTGKQCRTGCPQGTYGELCSGDCSNCETKCNPVNGSCLSCKPGWMDPIFACSRECPRWTYGYRCKYLCESKCGEDCVERVMGTCPGSKAFVSIVIPFIISPVLGCALLIIACHLVKNRNNQCRILKDCTTGNEASSSASVPSVETNPN